jgi:hypothetical protein
MRKIIIYAFLMMMCLGIALAETWDFTFDGGSDEGFIPYGCTGTPDYSGNHFGASGGDYGQCGVVKNLSSTGFNPSDDYVITFDTMTDEYNNYFDIGFTNKTITDTYYDFPMFGFMIEPASSRIRAIIDGYNAYDIGCTLSGIETNHLYSMKMTKNSTTMSFYGNSSSSVPDCSFDISDYDLSTQTLLDLQIRGGDYGQYHDNVLVITSSPVLVAPESSRGAFHQCNINPDCNKQLVQSATEKTSFSVVGGEKFNLITWINNLIINIRKMIGLEG